MEKLVKECSPYLEEAEIKTMEYDELIKEIQTSRKETAKLFSQELKNAYYQAKAEALRLAKFEKIKSEAGAVNTFANDFETNYKDMKDKAKEQVDQMRGNLTKHKK